MYGHPQDVQGECNAHLYLGDDWGDNECTIRCQLEPGHGGKHRESFARDGKVVIEWDTDERKEREAREAEFAKSA